MLCSTILPISASFIIGVLGAKANPARNKISQENKTAKKNYQKGIVDGLSATCLWLQLMMPP